MKLGTDEPVDRDAPELEDAGQPEIEHCREPKIEQCREPEIEHPHELSGGWPTAELLGISESSISLACDDLK